MGKITFLFKVLSSIFPTLASIQLSSSAVLDVSISTSMSLMNISFLELISLFNFNLEGAVGKALSKYYKNLMKIIQIFRVIYNPA